MAISAALAVAGSLAGGRPVADQIDTTDRQFEVARNNERAAGIISALGGAVVSFGEAVQGELAEVGGDFAAPSSETDAHERATERAPIKAKRAELLDKLSTARCLPAWIQTERLSLVPGKVRPGNFVELRRGDERHLLVVYNDKRLPNLPGILASDVFTEALGQELWTLHPKADLFSQIVSKVGGGTVEFDGEGGWEVRVF